MVGGADVQQGEQDPHPGRTESPVRDGVVRQTATISRPLVYSIVGSAPMGETGLEGEPSLSTLGEVAGRSRR